MIPIKLFLVNEVPLIGSIFASVLAEEPDMQVAGCVTSVQEALSFLETQPVDVAVVSVGLPDEGTLLLTRTIVDRFPSTKVLILGLSEEEKNPTLRYIEAGAAGYILKDSSL